MTRPKAVVVTPWAGDEELGAFLGAWGLTSGPLPNYLIMQHDAKRDGCGVTKNRGVALAVKEGAEVVVVLDSDCFPPGATVAGGVRNLEELIAAHVAALRPQPVKMFEVVTDPPSRGTPYGGLTATMPVAASMGFWTKVGDYCAVRQLTYGAEHQMAFWTDPVFARYFPLCGMNVAFRPADWSPWCRFIQVSRFDDIWMGWLWQKEAYRRGYCFNLGGPVVLHSRQSNVWNNLRDEAIHLEASEALWSAIALSDATEYDELVKLLPDLEKGKR